MGWLSNIAGSTLSAFKIGGKATLDGSGLTAARTLTLPDQAGTVALAVPGSIIPFAGITLPSGWLECDGAAVAVATYPSLYAVMVTTFTGTVTSGNNVVTVTAGDLTKILIGAYLSGNAFNVGTRVTAVGSGTITASQNALFSGAGQILYALPWGPGDHVNIPGATFNLPDLRGRALFGAGSGSGLTTRNVGVTGGAETITLAEANLPSHTHSLAIDTSGTAAQSTGAGKLATTATTSELGRRATADAPNEFTLTSAIQATGSGTAVDKMPPWAAVRWLIKT